MFKTKNVFTAISVWFSFHLIVFFVIGPSMVNDIPDMSDRALFMTSSMMQFAGIMSLFIGVLLYLCRDLELSRQKSFYWHQALCSY